MRYLLFQITPLALTPQKCRAPIVDRPDVRGCVTRLRDFEEGKTDLGLSEVTDGRLRSLLASMLDIDPRKRPNVLAVQLALNFCG
jgi:hypothetical protein